MLLPAREAKSHDAAAEEELPAFFQRDRADDIADLPAAAAFAGIIADNDVSAVEFDAGGSAQAAPAIAKLCEFFISDH